MQASGKNNQPDEAVDLAASLARCKHTPQFAARLTSARPASVPDEERGMAHFMGSEVWYHRGQITGEWFFLPKPIPAVATSCRSSMLRDGQTTK